MSNLHTPTALERGVNQLALAISQTDRFVCDFRIQRYEDLITPVDDQGRSAAHCEFVDTEFSPYCQLGEFLFDRRYRITPQNCRIQS